MAKSQKQVQPAPSNGVLIPNPPPPVPEPNYVDSGPVSMTLKASPKSDSGEASPQADAPVLYTGTKTVLARPLNRQAYVDYRGWILPAGEDAAEEGYLVEYTDGGKPNDPRHAGYISWSPKDVFERAYHPATDTPAPPADDDAAFVLRTFGVPNPERFFAHGRLDREDLARSVDQYRHLYARRVMSGGQEG